MKRCKKLATHDSNNDNISWNYKDLLRGNRLPPVQTSAGIQNYRTDDLIDHGKKLLFHAN